MDEQLRIPMPVVGYKISVVRWKSGDWEVVRRELRQDDGWRVTGEWVCEGFSAALLRAQEALYVED